MKKAKPTDAQIVARHYVIAALWADCEDGTHPRETREAIKKAERLAWEFLEIIGPDVLAQIEASHGNGYGMHPDCGTDRPWLAAVGHDLWLTSQGHGVGFWCRDELPDRLSALLTEAAKRFSGIYADFYRGWLYFGGTGPLSIERIQQVTA